MLKYLGSDNSFKADQTLLETCTAALMSEDLSCSKSVIYGSSEIVCPFRAMWMRTQQSESSLLDSLDLERRRKIQTTVGPREVKRVPRNSESQQITENSLIEV